MPPRRRRKRNKSSPKVHDRRAQGLQINSSVAIATVQDPYGEVGDQITVLRSIRDDPLAGMRARSQIDECQLLAGRYWQKLQDTSQIGGVKALDPGKDVVDGGRLPEPITDHQIRAIKELKRADNALGLEGRALIHDILGHRLSIAQAAAKRGSVGQRGREYTGQRFREALDTLAEVFGLATKKPGPYHARQELERVQA